MVLISLNSSVPIGHTDDSGEQTIEAALLQHLSREEQQSVLQTTAAGDEDDLEQFSRYVN